MKPEHLETALIIVKNIDAGEWIEVTETTKLVYNVYYDKSYCFINQNNTVKYQTHIPIPNNEE